MSPAGYWSQLHAAIEAGADAVYFGLRHFTARAKVGFALSELAEVYRTLHRRGVRGYVTYNTIIFDHELKAALEGLEKIADAGADAVIIQDLGLCRLAHQHLPDLELHASTQMSVTDAASARKAVEFGASRVTLARELSIDEIRALKAEVDVELETFVHGALCVAYSGQCFSSEAWGGRSANRGQCAQACRLPYEMMVDGEWKDLGAARYPLSPGDLYGLHHVAELMDAGVASFKIEGRYKDADYVAATTRAYRQAIDDAWAGRKLTVTREEELRLEQVYSRGLGAHFITGTNHQHVVNGRAPRHRGVRIGTVDGFDGALVLVRTNGIELKPGDGLVFDAADWRSPEEPEEGGRVFTVEMRSKGLAVLGFANGALNMGRIRAGDWVWRTDDPAVSRSLKVYTHATAPVRKLPLDVVARLDEESRLVTAWNGVVTVSSAPLDAARTNGLTAESLRKQFEKLGGTQFELRRLDFQPARAVFAPASVLNELRRRAVEALDDKLSTRPAVRMVETGLEAPSGKAADGPARLHVLIRTPDQLEAAIALRPATLTLDYLDLYGLKPSLERVRQAGVEARVATPRVLKPGEEKIADFLLGLDCKLLIRPLGLAGRAHGTGDFSLNAANRMTARELLATGLDRITPTHDLNGAQVAELARQVGGARIEVVIYQHLPVFHTEHCVFCRFLSSGTSYKDCGRPCEVHRVELADAAGRRHPVLADVGCRNTVFGAEAQEASAHLEAWLKAGIRDFRLEFAHESAEEVEAVTRAFDDALHGRTTFAELGARLAAMAPGGTTEGSLTVAADYLELPVLD